MTDRDRGQRGRQQEKEIKREIDRRELRREMERRDREKGEEKSGGEESAHSRRANPGASPDGRTRMEEEGSGAQDEAVAEHLDAEHSEGARSDQSEGDELRLVSRGVLANSPWRLFISLKAVVAAAFGTGAYALIFPTIWQLGDALGWPRLVALMVVSIMAMIFWMIVGHSLWERPTHEAERNPRITPAMQNAVTLLTLTLAVLVSYAVLFLLILLAAWVFVSDSIIQSSLGHPVDFGDYATLAWVATSISTITGALGSGLENDDEVREAVNYR